jgi:PAS domain-containing protein
VGRDESVGRKKYQAPTLTRVAFTSLSEKGREEIAQLISQTASEGQLTRRSKDEFCMVLDLEGRFKRASEQFCALVGYAQNELVGRPIDDVTASRTVHIPQHLGAVVHFGQFHCLWMFVHRDGHGVLVRSDWELLADLSMEVCGELLVA